MTLRDEARNTAYVTAAFMIAMAVVTWVIAPFQRVFLPEVTAFAALVFLPHGVRVLSAWLFGWRSVVYLFIAATVAHLVLTPELPLVLKTVAAITLSGVCAALAFAILKVTGHDLRTMRAEPSAKTWRGLMFVAFISSTINSLGHNLLFAQEIWPVGSMKIFLAFLVGDTLGTFVAFAGLMLLLRGLRRSAILSTGQGSGGS